MNILPDSRPRTVRHVVNHLGYNWVPIYCANCGADGGFVPEDNMDFAFYLCDTCAEKLPSIEGTWVEPDTEYWKRVKEQEAERMIKENARADGLYILPSNTGS